MFKTIKNKKIKNSRRLFASGQVTIAALLLLAVVAIIGLTATHETTTDVRLSRVQEESVKAFSAAEAGIEEAMYLFRKEGLGNRDFQLDLDDITKANVETEVFGEGVTEFELPVDFAPQSSGYIWLADHDINGDINELAYYEGSSLGVCWQNNAALEFVLFYKDTSGEYSTARWAFDPDSGQRSVNNFNEPNFSCSGWPNGAEVSLADAPSYSSPLFLAIYVYRDNTRIMARSSGVDIAFNFAQGQIVTSSGEVEKGEESVVRRMQIFQSWEAPPLFFLEPLFVHGDVVVD